MSEPCLIRLELDHDRSVFTAGEQVSGTVRIRVREDLKVAEARVEFRWLVDREKRLGRPDPDPVVEGTHVLAFNKEWSADSYLDFPFEMSVPLGPCTYRGESFDLDWEMAVVVFLESGVEVRESRRFKLEPGPPGSACDLGPRRPIHEGRHNIGNPLSMTAGFPLLRLTSEGASGAVGKRVMLIGTMVVVMIGYGLISAGDGAPLPARVILGLLMAVFGGMVVWVLIKRAAGRRLGSPTVIVRPETVQRDGALDLRIEMRPDKDTRLLRLTAGLELQEWCLQTIRNKNTTSHLWRPNEIWSRETVLADNRDLVAGRSLKWEPTLELPEGAFPSFGGEEHKLVWSVRVTAELKGAPDWSTRKYVTVTA